MKTMWGLCLLCLAGSLRAARAAPVRKSGRMEDVAALQEDVNVLMFGAIQLSESLNYVYETTEAKIALISQTVRRHEGTLHKLGRETEQAAEVEKQIEEVMHLLQVRKTLKYVNNGFPTWRSMAVLLRERYPLRATIKLTDLRRQERAIEAVCQVCTI